MTDFNINTTESMDKSKNDMEISRLKMIAEINKVDIGRASTIPGIRAKIEEAGIEIPDALPIKLEPIKKTDVDTEPDKELFGEGDEEQDEPVKADKNKSSDKPKSLIDKDVSEMTREEKLQLAQEIEAEEKINKYRADKRQKSVSAELSRNQVNMQAAIDGMEKVNVYLPYSPLQPEVIPVLVNGIRKDVRVNEDVPLPKAHAEVLKMAKDEEYKNHKRSKRMEKDFKSYKNVQYM